MVKIGDNPREFLVHLETGEGVKFYDDSWSAPDFLDKYFSIGFASTATIAEHLLRSIDDSELQGEWVHPNASLKEKMQDYVACAKWVSKRLKSEKESVVKAELKLRVDRLKEHLHIEPKTRNPAELFERITLRATAWAEKRWNIAQKELTAAQQAQIDQLKSYPQLMQRLLASDALFQRFATWSLTYECGQEQSVEIFRNFPGLTQKLMHAELHQTIGYHGGLKCDGDAVTLPALLEEEGKLKKGRINLLDPKATHIFANKYAVTVEKILDIFSQFNHRWDIRGTHFIYGGDGIQNFNPYQHGSWDPSKKEWQRIDFSQANFIEHFPKIHKIYEKADLEATYQMTVNAGEWALVLEAGRDNALLDAGNSHGWVKIFKPINENQYELVVAFSRSARENYKTGLKKAKLFMNTVPGGLCINEPRIYEKEQQFRGLGFSIAQEKSATLLRSLGTMADKAHQGKLYYQVVGDNCFKPIIEFVKEHVGQETFAAHCAEEDLKMHPLDFYVPSAFSRKLHQLLKSSAYKIQKFCLWTLATLFGQHRSMEIDGKLISVASHSTYAKELKVYAPPKFIGLKPTPFL
ncbi:MAG: hypothetical protein CK425_07590 [Parachlamydia sp.]|nr:MAG: hypothetical protein CK425_07590 [Parachlamydia sp.]